MTPTPAQREAYGRWFLSAVSHHAHHDRWANYPGCPKCEWESGNGHRAVTDVTSLFVPDQGSGQGQENGP